MTDNVYKILPQYIQVQKDDDTSYIFKFPDDNSLGQLKNTGDGTLVFNSEGEQYIIRDEKPIGTNGGTFNNKTWVTRDLNTLVKHPNTSTNISLSNNEFTLQTGCYEISVKAPCLRVGDHQCRLYNVTTSTVEAVGLTSYSSKEKSASSSTSILEHIIDVPSQEIFKIEHYCDTKRTEFGFGLAGGFGTEVYTTINIIKLS